ncbi:AAA family ATPase [Aeromonas caviae]
MLSKISLANFKSFKNLEDLDLRKLTVIAGKNSCGKSSILQSLLLLKQSLGAKDKASLVLDGDYLTYSNLQDISFGKPQINHSKIGYTFETLSVKGETIKYCVEFKNKNINGNYFPRVSKLYKLSNEKKIHLNNIPSDKNTKEFLLNILSTKNGDNDIEFTVGEIKYDAFIPESIDVQVTLESHELRNFELPYMALTSFSDIYPLIKVRESIRKIKYLSPVRATPDRAYVHYSLDADALLHDGSNSAHVLWSKKEEQVLWKNKKLPLIEALSECLDCMGLSQQIKPERIGDILYKVSVSDKNSKYNLSLADVGFGYSQT